MCLAGLDTTAKGYSATFLFEQVSWDTWTSGQASNCDGIVLEIYLDHKFQWAQVGLNCESLAYEVVT